MLKSELGQNVRPEMLNGVHGSLAPHHHLHGRANRHQDRHALEVWLQFGFVFRVHGCAIGSHRKANDSGWFVVEQNDNGPDGLLRYLAIEPSQVLSRGKTVGQVLSFTVIEIDAARTVQGLGADAFRHTRESVVQDPGKEIMSLS